MFRLQILHFGYSLSLKIAKSLPHHSTFLVRQLNHPSHTCVTLVPIRHIATVTPSPSCHIPMPPPHSLVFHSPFFFFVSTIIEDEMPERRISVYIFPFFSLSSPFHYAHQRFFSLGYSKEVPISYTYLSISTYLWVRLEDLMSGNKNKMHLSNLCYLCT